MRKWLRNHIQLHRPQWDAEDFRRAWWRVWFGHGGDEYGNCSFYLTTMLLGGFTVYPFPHYQTKVELPEPGTCSWVDQRYHPGHD